ncbi:hypothetical protein [Cryptosporangium arvum]|nr:hypothetical protein [Cryptosporangium arvum]
MAFVSLSVSSPAASGAGGWAPPVIDRAVLLAATGLPSTLG